MRDSWKLEDLRSSLAGMKHIRKCPGIRVRRTDSVDFGSVTQEAIEDAVAANWDLVCETAIGKLKSAIRARAEQMKHEAESALKNC